MHQLLSKILVFTVFLAGCTQNTAPKRGVYYWKTIFELDQQCASRLKQVNTEIIYLRFFDVDWDAESKSNQPVGIVKTPKHLPSFQYIPVVYITVRAIQNESQPGVLAKNMVKLIRHISKNNRIPLHELQIDCDWTKSTREAYFKLLSLLKTQLPETKLSATIRLHQIKYSEASGIPPVDKGMLMFYNMGKLNPLSTSNSIYDPEVAKKYTNYIKSYPLSLDLALPAFEWFVQYRNHRPVAIINKINRRDLEDTTRFILRKENFWQSAKGHFIHNTYFQINDIIKREAIAPGKCKEAAALLQEAVLPQQHRNIVLFSLNDFFDQNFDHHELETIYSTFQ